MSEMNLKPDESKADRFWKWFDEHKNNYVLANQADEQKREKLLGIFLNELHRYNPNIFFNMGGRPDSGKNELIITAEGIKKHFPAVEFLVSRAPKFKDWTIIA